jgi:hypothetical protein
MDDAIPGSQHFDAIAKLAARLDAELDRYADVGYPGADDGFTVIGQQFDQLRGDARGYGLFLRMSLTAAQLKAGTERGTVAGLAAALGELTVGIVDLSILTPGEQADYIKKGELDELANHLEHQAAIARALAKLYRET